MMPTALAAVILAAGWLELAPVLIPRQEVAVAAANGKLYVIGGISGSGILNSVEEYDRSTGSGASSLAPMPTPREHLAAAAVDGMLYVAGGRFTSGNAAAFERFDPSTGTWTILPPVPTARSGIAAAALGQRVYVFGGEGNEASSTGVFAQTESYDVTTGTWRSEPDMRNPRHGIGAATVGELIHIPAGSPLQGFGTTPVHDAFFAHANRRRAVRK